MKKFTRLAAFLIAAIVLLLGLAPQMALAQESPTVTVTCNGVTVSNVPRADMVSVARDLGCGSGTAETPATTVTAGGKTCRVNSGANLRSSAGMGDNIIGGALFGNILNVIEESNRWLHTTNGWIWAPLCTMVPPSIWTPPADSCEETAKVLPNGDKIDLLIGERGEKIQVTILSSGDLCDPYRVIWDGVRIRQDRLPKEGERRPFEADFQGWWTGAATWAGVSCLLEQDKDKNPATPRLAVFDHQGYTVGSTHGTQVFDLEAGGWYMAVCSGTENPGFTVIKPTNAWTRP